MKQSLRIHAALFLVNLIYAGNYSIAKLAMPDYIKPFGFIFIRVLSATVLYGLVQSALVRERIERKDWPRLAVCGIFGVAINQLMFFKGLSITTPINASLIMITTPILVLVMSAVILKEAFTVEKILGICLGAAGYFLVISGSDFTFSSDTVLGDIYVMINASSYAIYLILVKPLLAKYHPLTVIKWVFLFGFFPVTFFGFGEFRSIEWHTFNSTIWASLLYVVLGTTFLAYMLNIFALKAANPSLVGVYIYLQPILASIIAILFGQDAVTWVKVMAGALIFAGVYFVSRSQFRIK